jgi:hypothetical protein
MRTRSCLSATIIRSEQAGRGQSLVELAILFPILLIVFSGLIEFGFLLNEYLTLMDAARNAARFSSDGLYNLTDNDHACATTRDFYRQTACLVLQELSQEEPNIQLKPLEDDDIVVSVFSIVSGTGVTTRYPAAYGEAGWSYTLDLSGYGTRERSSRFSAASVNARLNALAPNTGLLLVEVFYSYEQKLKLPWITAFLDDPLILHAYTFMPLVSAEPRSP